MTSPAPHAITLSPLLVLIPATAHMHGACNPIAPVRQAAAQAHVNAATKSTRAPSDVVQRS
jgi:hypothetical protein